MNVKLKYYFRGIGIGILVTTVIFICAIAAKGGIMTDEKAVSRAEELGYTKDGGDASGDASYADISSQLEEYKNRQHSEDTSADAVNAEEQEQQVIASDADSVNKRAQQITDNAQDVQSEEEDTPGDTGEASGEETPHNRDTVSADKTVELVIYSNMSSESVSKRLEALGVIDNASDFNQYMISNGYSTRLQNGSFTIPQDATFEEITQILMRK
jgi:flagellar motility protein MotE (MotC chaperone)